MLLDDDAALRSRLGKALQQAGFDVLPATSLKEARALLAGEPFDYAVLDLRLGDGNGLDLVPDLRRARPSVRIIVLTAFGSIAAAVLAVKAGASDFLAKPAVPETVLLALFGQREREPRTPELPMPADRIRWEHIQRTFEQCGRNVSETARRLGMHRRSLQRMLAKRAPREQPVTRPAPARAPGRREEAPVQHPVALH